jgi:hypothetical protein
VFNEGFNPCLSPPEYNNSNQLLAAPQNPALPPLIDTDSNISLNYPCNSGGPPNNATRIKTYYTLSGPSGYIGTYTASSSYTSGGGFPTWSNLTSQLSVSLTQGSTYFLNVSTLGVTNSGNNLASSVSTSDGNRSWGIHNYGLLVTTGSGPTTNTHSTSYLADGASLMCSGANCPAIYANTSTAMAATIVSPVCTSSCGSGSAATAYLADIPTAAVGKQVTLKLWDPGDYAQYMQIIQPDGTPLPSFAYKVYGADPNSASAYGGTVPNPNNTTDPGNSNVTTCLDPLNANQQMVDPTTGNPVSGPCLPVDGCGSYQATAPPVVACGTVGTGTWGGPNNRFGMAPYNDALVDITFTVPANESGWWGIKEATSQTQVHDTLTANLFVDGLPPHLTP